MFHVILYDSRRVYNRRVISKPSLDICRPVRALLESDENGQDKILLIIIMPKRLFPSFVEVITFMQSVDHFRFFEMWWHTKYKFNLYVSHAQLHFGLSDVGIVNFLPYNKFGHACIILLYPICYSWYSYLGVCWVITSFPISYLIFIFFCPLFRRFALLPFALHWPHKVLLKPSQELLPMV